MSEAASITPILYKVEPVLITPDAPRGEINVSAPPNACPYPPRLYPPRRPRTGGDKTGFVETRDNKSERDGRGYWGERDDGGARGRRRTTLGGGAARRAAAHVHARRHSAEGAVPPPVRCRQQHGR